MLINYCPPLTKHCDKWQLKRRRFHTSAHHPHATHQHVILITHISTSSSLHTSACHPHVAHQHIIPTPHISTPSPRHTSAHHPHATHQLDLSSPLRLEVFIKCQPHISLSWDCGESTQESQHKRGSQFHKFLSIVLWWHSTSCWQYVVEQYFLLLWETKMGRKNQYSQGQSTNYPISTHLAPL